MRKVFFLFSMIVFLQSSYIFAMDSVDNNESEANISGNDIVISDKFLDDLFLNSRIVVKKVDFEKIDKDTIDIHINVDFDLTHLCNAIGLNTVPVLDIPSYNDLISTGLGLSYYFFANEKEKPILRFNYSEGDSRSRLVKEYIDKNIFRYLIIQIDNNHFDQIFLSSRSGISLKESFNFVISGVPDNMLSEKTNIAVLIVDKKRPRYKGAPEVHPRIIVNKEYSLPPH